jgi:hypothetical protein
MMIYCKEYQIFIKTNLKLIIKTNMLKVKYIKNRIKALIK